MQQQGGSQYVAPPPELSPPFFSGGAGQRQTRMVGIHGSVDQLKQPVAEVASPISIRSAPPGSLFEEFDGGGGVVARSINDDEAIGGGEEGERGGSGVGNRWPRQETLVLLKVRSEMDPAFRDATLKGPLWEDVSRKLAELGYTRSAKKCKEKFENVHKYYKRTKEGRAGRQDGKSYRFFSQLEALHSTTPSAAASACAALTPYSSAANAKLVPSLTTDAAGLGCASMAVPHAPRVEQLPVEVGPVELSAPPTSQSAPELANLAAGAGVSFSTNTSSSSSSESDGGEETDDGCAGALQDGCRKRKRDGWFSGSGKTMALFKGMMKQLLERQEVMQQRFLDTIEKREQDRMIREEAWKLQEMARLNREYELMAQERSMAANRDAAVISFLQKFTGRLKNPLHASTATFNSTLASPEPSMEEAPPLVAQPENQKCQQRNDIVLHQTLPTSEPDTAEAAAELPEVIAGGCIDMVSPSSLSSSRWPKTEVLALIKLRSGLETRYMDAGPKGPLWEEISLGMKRLGYNRSSKRCKEKWENINKYFKKVKEGNKKRPEDAKTCPYYHELDALYRKKQQQDVTAADPAAPSSSAGGLAEQERNKTPPKAKISVGNGGNHEIGGVQIPRSNGIGLSQVFFGAAMSGGVGVAAALKKPEDILKELMDQQHHGDDDEYDDDDDDDNDDDDDDEEDEDGKMRYEIQFQSQSATGASSIPRGSNGVENASVPSPASNPGSFLAMVQ